MPRLADLLLEMARYAKGLWGQDLGLAAADFADLDDEAQLHLFTARAETSGLARHEGSLEQLRRVVAVFRANVQAFRAYRFEGTAPYAGQVTLFRAAEGEPPVEPDFGWGRVSARPVAVHVVPGDHITLLAEPQVQALAQLLRAALDAASSSPGKAAL